MAQLRDASMKSDTISRKAAIDVVNRPICPTGDATYDNAREVERESIREELEQLTSVDQWIPCSERLPEEHEWVGTKRFGTTISDKVHITFDVNGERFVKTLSLQNGELSNHEKHIMDTFYKGWKMIAWMPLPEPYQERS